MDNATKSILLSKTFWVNVLTAVVIVLNRNAQVVDPLLIEPFVIMILPLVNIGLRAVTKKTVSLKGK
jgi:hypothetical protein|tara:strand:+ start:299 stop:499 length:201 start_codon:yes stop_codon:yes gene_type:complete